MKTPASRLRQIPMHLNYTNPYDILLYRKRKTFEEANSLNFYGI